MTSHSGPEAFLQQTDLQAARTEPPGSPAAGLRVAYQTDREEAVIVGSDLIVFAKEVAVEQRRDVVNAAALAQLVASKQVPQPKTLEDVSNWYSAYVTTLSNVGFVVQDYASAGYATESGAITPYEVVVDRAKAVVSSAPSSLASLAVALRNLDTLSRLPAESAAMSTLNRQMRSAQVARFQLILVEPDSSGQLLLSMVAVVMEIRSNATPALFATFKTDDIALREHWGKATANTAILTAVRDALASKVGPYMENLVASSAQDSRQEWLQLAPRPRPLRDGQRWHIYISYRSVHRTWVLQLYDVLHTLGYEVFLDQLVVTPGADLQRTIEEGIERSAAALLVWSSATEHSSWGRHEYEALLRREESQKDFHFIVLTLDKTPLPPMLVSRLYVDFSESREGPSGTPLLQLLYGLQSQPLPREVVSQAAHIDEEVRSSIARIQAARSVGDAERLSGLASSEGHSWYASPTLLCRVAEALIALRETDRALTVLEQCRRRFPKALRPRQLLGLALARKGDWQEAQLVLEELYSSGERDTETVGILARTWMDRYKVTGDQSFLRRSRDLYAEAFTAAPDDSYVGINAASKSVLLGEMERARSYARQLVEIVGTDPTGDYWRTVTSAELLLILGEFHDAARLYRAGIAEDPRALGSHQSTHDQARLLLDAMQASPADRETVLSAFADVAAAQVAATATAAGSHTPLTPTERELVANLLFQLVAARLAAPDLLVSLDQGRFWEAVRKARPRATRDDLPSVAQTVTGPGRPSPLWLAWMQTVRSRDLDRFVES